MMNLKEVVERYLSAAGSFGKPVQLAVFGLEHAETEALFGALDEDYHISRYFHFHQGVGEKFKINGFPHTDISIDEEIRTIL